MVSWRRVAVRAVQLLVALCDAVLGLLQVSPAAPGLAKVAHPGQDRVLPEAADDAPRGAVDGHEVLQVRRPAIRPPGNERLVVPRRRQGRAMRAGAGVPSVAAVLRRLRGRRSARGAKAHRQEVEPAVVTDGHVLGLKRSAEGRPDAVRRGGRAHELQEDETELQVPVARAHRAREPAHRDAVPGRAVRCLGEERPQGLPRPPEDFDAAHAGARPRLLQRRVEGKKAPMGSVRRARRAGLADAPPRRGAPQLGLLGVLRAAREHGPPRVGLLQRLVGACSGRRGIGHAEDVVDVLILRQLAGEAPAAVRAFTSRIRGLEHAVPEKRLPVARAVREGLAEAYAERPAHLLARPRASLRFFHAFAAPPRRAQARPAAAKAARGGKRS